MRILILNGRIVTAVDSYTADILVEEETIAAIGKNLAPLVGAVDRSIDATGKLLLPGGIDPHTHLELLVGGTCSSDDFETGTRAAAFGGTTTLIDFAEQHHGQALSQALDARFSMAVGKAAIDYGFHLVITDLPDQRLPELKEMIRQGVSSFKLFMAYPGTLMVDDATIFKVMSMAGENGGLVCMHAENGMVIDVLIKRALAAGQTAPKYHAMARPTKAEAEGVRRAIALAEMAGSPVYIVHLSCYDALKEVQAARDRNLAVFAETCPQYLLLEDTLYEGEDFEGAKYVMTPPLRPKSNQEMLWRGLRSDDLQVIATDHCPFHFKGQKEMGRGDFSKIPGGGPGVENRMSLIYHHGVVKGRISLNRFVELTSTAAAKIFGLFPKKGTIAVGSDADLVVFDPDREQTISSATHHMRVDYSAYEGWKVKGVVEIVLSRGHVLVAGGQFFGRPGGGQFLKRGTLGA